MRLYRLANIVLLTLACATPAFASEPVSSLLDGRDGRIYYESYSPFTSSQVVHHRKSVKKAVVYGDLEFPNEGAEKVPAMVVVHGSGGWVKFQERYIDALHEMGVATFRSNSFIPRGVKKTVGKQTSVTTAMVATDALKALELLRTHPRIDPDRIGVMGWSKGGGASLVTSYDKFRRLFVDGDVTFALHIPFYPPCFWVYEEVDQTPAPLRVLAGAKDNYTPSAPCERLVRQLQDAGADAEITVYPDADHGFDSDNKWQRVDDSSVGDCRLIMGKDGWSYDEDTGIKLDSRDKSKKVFGKCLKKGVTVGRNDAAARAAMSAVRSYVAQYLLQQ